MSHLLENTHNFLLLKADNFLLLYFFHFVNTLYKYIYIYIHTYIYIYIYLNSYLRYVILTLFIGSILSRRKKNKFRLKAKKKGKRIRKQLHLPAEAKMRSTLYIAQLTCTFFNYSCIALFNLFSTVIFIVIRIEANLLLLIFGYPQLIIRN